MSSVGGSPFLHTLSKGWFSSRVYSQFFEHQLYIRHCLRDSDNIVSKIGPYTLGTSIYVLLKKTVINIGKKLIDKDVHSKYNLLEKIVGVFYIFVLMTHMLGTCYKVMTVMNVYVNICMCIYK